MIFYPNRQTPTDVKLVSQGVDTIVTSHICKNEDDYITKFLPFLKKLEDLKESAQCVESHNNKNRFVKTSLLGFGQFKIYAQGMGMYKYVLENEDITMFVSTTKFQEDGQTPQIKVEFRSHFLFALSHKKAYAVVLKLIHKILGETRNLLNRIDLYSDVQGVKYTSLDELRFQTNFKQTDFSIRKHSKFKQVTGFSFGNGDFMFRIYDKTKEIKLRQNKAFIKYKWIMNNYDIKKELPVFRHECQYRRPTLQKFMEKKSQDEVLFFFNLLHKLWHNAVNKIRWTDLSNDEIIRISENNLKSDSIRQIFYRARQDNTRINFWNILSKFENKLATQISTYKHVKEPQDKTAKKFLKAYIGATYKARGNDPQHLINIIDEVTQDLRDYLGITLHDYGELKVVSNFIEQSKALISQGLMVEIDHTQKAFSLYSKLSQRLKNITDKGVQTELKKADKFFQTIKVS